MPDPSAMLARRWSGIRKALARHLLAAVLLGGVWSWTRWEWPAIVAFAVAGLGVSDTLIRTWRTLRLRSVARHPEWVQPVRVTRHFRQRYRIPDLHIAGLWPEGSQGSPEPPLSVRVEDVGELPEGGEVLVYGRLQPRRHVLLVHDGEIVWPVRRVRAWLRPRHLGPYPYGNDEDEDDD